jgi:hypothetical protein
MTINIKFNTIDFWAKDIFYQKIYSGLNLDNYYSGIIIINYLDNTEDEYYFTYKDDPSIPLSFFDDKSCRSIEHIYYFVRSIINKSDKDILFIELEFTKEEDEWYIL